MIKRIMKYSLYILCLILTSSLGLSAQGEWTALQQRLQSKDSSELCVLHLGDSHLSGGYMTSPIIQALHQRFGTERIRIERFGIPGATYATFTAEKHLKRLREINADLIIISLGTNDSYSKRFNPETLRFNMEHLISLISRGQQRKPMFVLTTPPLSYLRQRVQTGTRRGKRRRRIPVYGTQYHYNRSAEQAAQTIVSFAQRQGYGYYDLTSAIAEGNGAEAANRWLSMGLLHTDRVHYTRAGYDRIGNMVATALLELLDSKPKNDSRPL